MGNRRRRWVFLGLAGVGGGLFLISATLTPPAGPVLGVRPDDASENLVRGSIHVHTNRSDGEGSPDAVAAAAGRAGLDFLILTDHGDGTREPDPPRYRHGVLVLDAVEISTTGGHYLAVGLPRAPYPLGGDPAGVVQDVRRLGGFGIVAHPTSPNKDLGWRDWQLDVDAVEWINGDDQWRDESIAQLAVAAGRYLFGRHRALASLFDRPVVSLARWDELTRDRTVVGLPGGDAHGRFGYEPLFRTLAAHVLMDVGWSGRADTDAELLLAALAAGRVMSVVDAAAVSGRLQFDAVVDGKAVAMGERVAAGRRVEFRARGVFPPTGRLVLLADGVQVTSASTETGGLRYLSDDPRPGAYRVEVHLDDAPGSPPVPWIVTNPIYIGAPRRSFVERARRPASVTASRRLGAESGSGEEGVPGAWTTEHDPETTADVRQDDSSFRFSYRLGGATAPSPYAALVRSLEIGALTEFDVVSFYVRATRPVRLSLQVRSGQVEGQPRWRESFYADQTRRRVSIRFSDLVAVEMGLPGRPDLPRVDSLLWVAELINATRGSDAVVWVGDPQLERW